MPKLNSLTVQKSTKPGFLCDGNGLYLQIANGGTKSWVFRFQLNGKRREMGLGPLVLVTLAEARVKAIECRKQVQAGVDPIEAREQQMQVAIAEKSKALTFKECAEAYIETHKSGWKNVKHAVQWESTLKTYAFPLIGDLAVKDIDTNMVMRVLTPIWTKKTETASRVRSRIELILSWATVRGYRCGENCARWRGHLDNLLPKKSDVQPTEHFEALPFSEVSSFIKDLRSHLGVGPLALEFLILTACRTNEVRGAKWVEINFEESLWVIPASRMKAKREHRVPLSPRALEILNTLRETYDSEYVFPGGHEGKSLSSQVFLTLLRRHMEIKGPTPHGFRSSFRDWAAERTNYPTEVIEMALAHTIKDKVEAAYRRGDLLLKRRALMNDWAKYCDLGSSKTAPVIDLGTMAAENN